MKKSLLFLLSIWFYCIIFILILLFFSLTIIVWSFTFLFDTRLIVLHKSTSIWARLTLFFNPLWRVNFQGNENVEYFKKYIILSNHQSMLDILVLAYLKAHFKWVSKSEIFKIPFIGWTMSLNKYIKLNRNNYRSIPKMMSDCKKEINKGSSVLIFPEGTRSGDGKIHKFKDGAFQLALEMKLPILPIVLDGTVNIIESGSWFFQKKETFKIQVLNEIPYEDYKHLSKQELRDVVYEKINNAFIKLKN